MLEILWICFFRGQNGKNLMDIQSGKHNDSIRLKDHTMYVVYWHYSHFGDDIMDQMT